MRTVEPRPAPGTLANAGFLPTIKYFWRQNLDVKTQVTSLLTWRLTLDLAWCDGEFYKCNFWHLTNKMPVTSCTRPHRHWRDLPAPCR